MSDAIELLEVLGAGGNTDGPGIAVRIAGLEPAMRSAVLGRDAVELARLLALAAGTRNGQPGPVHLNVAFSEPLVPGVEPTPSARELVVAPRASAAEALPLDAGPQTVIVAGDLRPERGRSVAAQAARAGIPLLVLVAVGLFTILALKLLVFVVLPVLAIVWLYRKFSRSGDWPAS